MKYFSQSKDRIFVRATSVIGRNAQTAIRRRACTRWRNREGVQGRHARPRGLLDHLEGQVVFIRYFAVRIPSGKYLGTLEVTQDLTEIRSLSGERKLLDD